MKKSLCLILVLTLCLGSAFALASCKKGKDIYDIAAELAPTKTVTSVDYTAANGDDLGAWYTLESDGGDSIFTYEYKRYRTSAEAIEDNDPSTIKTISGKLYCKDGKVSEDGVNWTSSPVPTTISLNLAPDKLEGAVISEDGKTLTATITKENAVAVIGTDLAADGALSLTVKSNGTYLTEVVISCTTVEGAAVCVRTSYSYNKLTLEFPEA